MVYSSYPAWLHWVAAETNLHWFTVPCISKLSDFGLHYISFSAKLHSCLFGCRGRLQQTIIELSQDELTAVTLKKTFMQKLRSKEHAYFNVASSNDVALASLVRFFPRKWSTHRQRRCAETLKRDHDIYPWCSCFGTCQLQHNSWQTWYFNFITLTRLSNNYIKQLI